MAVIPGYLLRHTAEVERYLGDGAHGPIYADPEVHLCFWDRESRILNQLDGRQIVSGSTLYFKPDAGITVEDRIRLDGRPVTVLQVKVRDGGGLPTPDHIEVALQ